jgi:hypothetical protein
VAETGEPYAFTGDDPLNATDPLGLLPYDCHTKAQCSAQEKNRKRVADEENAALRAYLKAQKRVHIIDIAGAIGHFVAKHKVGELELGGAILTVAAAVASGGSSLVVEGTVDAAVDGGTAAAASSASSWGVGLNAASTVVNGAGCALGQGAGRDVSCAGAVAGLGGTGLGLASSAAGASDGLVQLNNLYSAFSVAGLLPAWAIATNK